MKPRVFLQAELIAEAYQLGQSTAAYRGEPRPLQKASLGCILVFLLAMVMFFLIETIGSVNQITPGEPATIFTIILGLFCFALLVLFGGFWYRWVAPHDVLFCPEGLVSLQRHKIRVVRWDEVLTFQEARPGRVSFLEEIWFYYRRRVLYLLPCPFSLHTRQGKTLHFRSTFRNLAQAGPFKDPGARFEAEMDLANRVEREVSMRLWDKAVTAYQAGLPVTFGKVQVSAQAVRKGRKMRSWDEIDSLALESHERVLREFKRHELSPDTSEEADGAVPTSDLQTQYWQEEAGPTALIRLQVKEESREEQRFDWAWYVAEVPNALVFVWLIAYALHQQEKVYLME